MTRPTYTAAQVRARDLCDDDVILIVPGEGSTEVPQRRSGIATSQQRTNVDMPMWRDVMDVWCDGDQHLAEEHYTYADGVRDDEKIEFIREHLGGMFGSYVLVRYHVEQPGAVDCESELIAFRACDLVAVQQPENPAPAAAGTVVHENDILRVAREEIAAGFPDREALGVVFTATEYNGTYHVKNYGRVLFGDNVTTTIDFGPVMSGLLVTRYGKTPPGFTVVVNLLDGTIVAADHSDDFEIRQFFDQTPPGRG